MALAGMFLVMAVFLSVDSALSLICLHAAFPWSSLREGRRGASTHVGSHPV